MINEISLQPQENAIVFDATPVSVLILLPNSGAVDLPFTFEDWMETVYIGETNILKEYILIKYLK